MGGKERCAGDFCQVKDPKSYWKLPRLNDAQIPNRAELPEGLIALAKARGCAGRGWQTQGLIYDECYEFLQQVELVHNPGKMDILPPPGDT